jgi:RNA polymerase sigma-70 factor (ECF subfamily)
MGLTSLLADEVTLQSDGGGKVLAFPNVIKGLAKVTRLYLGLFRKYGPAETLVRSVWIDGLPGYVSIYDGTLQTTALEIESGRIKGIYKVRNPDKLSRIAEELASAPSGGPVH